MASPSSTPADPPSTPADPPSTPADPPSTPASPFPSRTGSLRLPAVFSRSTPGTPGAPAAPAAPGSAEQPAPHAGLGLGLGLLSPPAAAASTTASTPTASAAAASTQHDFAEFMQQAERRARQNDLAFSCSLRDSLSVDPRHHADDEPRPAGTLSKLFARRKQSNLPAKGKKRPTSLPPSLARQLGTNRTQRTPDPAPEPEPVPVPLEDKKAFPGHLPLSDDEGSQSSAATQTKMDDPPNAAPPPRPPSSLSSSSSPTTTASSIIVDPDTAAFQESLSSMLAASQCSEVDKGGHNDDFARSLGTGTGPASVCKSNTGLFAHPIYEQSGESLALSHMSSVSGRANPRLDEPLLELEQLEVDEFLKSFGKYTRHVDIPGAGTVRGRMPQWSDFRVPQDEARRIAQGQQGNSLITHIDRGLRAMLESEAETNVAVQPEVHRRNHKPGPTPPSGKPRNLKRTSFHAAQAVRSKARHFSETDEPPAPAPAAPPPNGVHAIAQDQIEEGDEIVDGVAFVIAYTLALFERYAPEELDNMPTAGYRESVSRNHLMRLYVIAPFWEQFYFDIRSLLIWRDPKRTSAAAMLYFILWYADLLPTAFFAYLIYHVCRFRFFPPEISVVRNNVLRRMKRSAEAENVGERLRRQSRLDILHIYKQWIDAFGSPTQMMLGDLADLHEKVKSLILWRNPTATKRTIGLLSLCGTFVTLADAHTVWKTALLGIGIFAFALFPLQYYYPRYRRPLNPIWWVLWGCPTDAQFAISILRQRHERELQADLARREAVTAKRSKPHKNHKNPKASWKSCETSTMAPDLTPLGDTTSCSGPIGSTTDGSVSPQTRITGLTGYSANTPDAAAMRQLAMDDTDPSSASRAASLIENRSAMHSTGTAPGPLASQKPYKLGSFFCHHRHMPGFLHVANHGIYFLGLHTSVTRNPARAFAHPDRAPSRRLPLPVPQSTPATPATRPSVSSLEVQVQTQTQAPTQAQVAEPNMTANKTGSAQSPGQDGLRAEAGGALHMPLGGPLGDQDAPGSGRASSSTDMGTDAGTGPDTPSSTPHYGGGALPTGVSTPLQRQLQLPPQPHSHSHSHLPSHPQGRRDRANVIPFGHIATLVKTKSNRLFFWQSTGLQVVRIDGTILSFTNMNQRDKAFNLILAACSRTLNP